MDSFSMSGINFSTREELSICLLKQKLDIYTHVYFFTTNLKLEQIWLRAHISILACYAMINFEAFKIHEVRSALPTTPFFI